MSCVCCVGGLGFVSQGTTVSVRLQKAQIGYKEKDAEGLHTSLWVTPLFNILDVAFQI